MLFKRIFLVQLLLTIASYSFCQSDTLFITSNSGELNGEVIVDYTNRWKMSHVDSTGNKTLSRIWTDYGQIMELDGENFFHRVQDLYDPQMNLVDTWINMVEHKSLLPVSSTTIKPSGLSSFISFEGTSASLTTNMKSEDSTIVTSKIDYGMKVYDWSLYGMLLVGLPFEEGLIAKMPISGVDQLQWLIANISDKETLQLPDGTDVQTWKVETNQRLIFWMSEKAPYVIQLELAMPDSTKYIWEMF